MRLTFTSLHLPLTADVNGSENNVSCCTIYLSQRQTRKACSIITGKSLFCFCLFFGFSCHASFNLLTFFYSFNRNIIHGQNNELQEMDQLQPALFKRMFCINRERFSEIQEAITPYMTAKNLQKGCNSSGG